MSLIFHHLTLRCAEVRFLFITLALAREVRCSSSKFEYGAGSHHTLRSEKCESVPRRARI